jgi:RNA polymerase sigma-70 factor (ECF subfamily)
MTGEAETVADRVLVARFLSRRDDASFRAIYVRHSPVVFALAARLSGSPTDGEDLLQETWIRAAERLESFRWESTLGTWLCGIAVNCWRERRRRNGRSGGIEEGLPAAVEDGPQDETPLPRAERIDLERAVAALADGFREVVVLHDVHGYTHEEIASLLGTAAGTSKSQLSRGRRSLREMLGDRRAARGKP